MERRERIDMISGWLLSPELRRQCGTRHLPCSPCCYQTSFPHTSTQDGGVVSCEPSKMERELGVSQLSCLLCSWSSRTHPCGQFGSSESQSKAVRRKATGVRSWQRRRGSCGLCLQCEYRRRFFTDPVSRGLDHLG